MSEPPLLLFDLDNTAIDRVAAFRLWLERFARHWALEPGTLGWLELLDDDGHRARPALFRAARERLGLDASVESLVAAYDRDYPACVGALTAPAVAALGRWRAAGWRLGVVTNGAPMQEAVIERSGLGRLVDGWCVSELVDLRKPDPRIFALAAERCGGRLAGGWMIGDSPGADIAGARAAGLRSVWLTRGLAWSEAGLAPTLSAETFVEALERALAEADARS